MMIFATILAIAASDLGNPNLPKENQKNAEDTKEETKDLGTYGETFPIKEQSLLDVIKAKLQKLSASGKLKDHQDAIAKKAKEQLNRPQPVRGIHKTTRPRSFTHDPTITVPYDLRDHQGQIFHSQGTVVNPLDTHHFHHPFLLVDGDDAEQVAWAIRQYKEAHPSQKPKIILVQGAPFELSKELGLPVYFDQSGILVKKFGITQIPARVSQKENAKVLTVEEVGLKDTNPASQEGLK